MDYGGYKHGDRARNACLSCCARRTYHCTRGRANIAMTVGGLMSAASAIRALSAFVFVIAAGFANPADIRVFSSGAPAGAAKAIAADFAGRTGHHLTFMVAQPAVIQAHLASGEKADVVILPSPVVTMLTGTGVLTASSSVDVARVGLGVVVRVGAALPDISDVAAFRQLLRNAHSIVYPDPAETGGGSAGLAVARMIDKLGLTETVRPKLKVEVRHWRRCSPCGRRHRRDRHFQHQ